MSRLIPVPKNLPKTQLALKMPTSRANARQLISLFLVLEMIHGVQFRWRTTQNLRVLSWQCKFINTKNNISLCSCIFGNLFCFGVGGLMLGVVGVGSEEREVLIAVNVILHVKVAGAIPNETTPATLCLKFSILLYCSPIPNETDSCNTLF